MSCLEVVHSCDCNLLSCWVPLDLLFQKAHLTKDFDFNLNTCLKCFSAVPEQPTSIQHHSTFLSEAALFGGRFCRILHVLCSFWNHHTSHLSFILTRSGMLGKNVKTTQFCWMLLVCQVCWVNTRLSIIIWIFWLSIINTLYWIKCWGFLPRIYIAPSFNTATLWFVVLYPGNMFCDIKYSVFAISLLGDLEA